VRAGEYLPIERQWAAGDTVTLNFPMPTEILSSNPRVTENAGRVAVQRGPIVYCMEQLDQPDSPTLPDVSVALGTKSNQSFEAKYNAELLDGVTVLHHKGAVNEKASSAEALYAPATFGAPKTKPQNLVLIPYYAWANRQSTAMEVWVAYVRA
jgi:DUF1680 family protein